MKLEIIKRSDIYDELYLKKAFNTYKTVLKLLVILNIITLKMIESILLNQAELANDLLIKAIERSIKK